ncbi:MAG: amidohydrolase family protein [Daejeonella sp.]|uniref:amidohydrolase family protein n=1 Tax=Daejeonella sp. TaxID=2805397 RepID=UPI0027359A2F|nr:amidohydrolase family protein [Daejeonella sp.]MDP3469565.1 amidohydrolase family protein [Daejeonella sp.]
MKKLFKFQAKLFKKFGLFILLIISSNVFAQPPAQTRILLKNLNLIDGRGGTIQAGTDILIQGQRISAIGRNLKSAGARVIDLQGKTVMPAMISAHVHVGVIKGNAQSGTFFTRENVLAQLKKYLDYGVITVQTLGTDRPVLYENGFRDSLINGLLPGARLFSGGFGFNIPDPSVSKESFMGNLYRPVSADEVPGMMKELNEINPSMVKIWVDGSPLTKMKPAIYQKIIQEAHRYQRRVAAHVYYLSDARNLISSGIDVFGHSIRDSLVDEGLIAQMKARTIPYIPTLALDKFAHVYMSKPNWLEDPFFKAALEPGVYEMISSSTYQNEQKASAAAVRSAGAFRVALQNVKKLHDAGVLVALGTDSGAFPIRAQGFAEHQELELLVEAGLSPQDVIRIATLNAARVLRIDQDYGSIEKGKVADLLILNANPLENIQNSRKIFAVYKAGQMVSTGPFVNE